MAIGGYFCRDFEAGGIVDGTLGVKKLFKSGIANDTNSELSATIIAVCRAYWLGPIGWGLLVGRICRYDV